MTDSTDTIASLKEKIAAFIKERDWEQYHDPKNLSMSIAIEANFAPGKRSLIHSFKGD